MANTDDWNGRGGFGPFCDALSCAAVFLEKGCGDGTPMPGYAADVRCALDKLRELMLTETPS